ncbi:MAG: TonB family protein [Vicinamibacterales bacterium]
MDTVSQVLAGRARDAAGLDRMLGASIAAHVVLLVLVAISPSFSVPQAEPEAVMTISLGGAPGPRNGGMTPLGGRPVQLVRPPEATPVREAVRAPAAREPEMVEPTKTAPRKTETKVPTAPVQKRTPVSRTPTKGDQVQAGNAVADTGGKGQGFGLTQGGGGTGATVDVGDFCCPDYLTTMLDLINRNWSSKQQVAGLALMQFTIQRDGTITGITTERSSGYAALDLLAQRALVLTRQFPPLPAQFTQPSLTVHLRFEYER